MNNEDAEHARELNINARRGHDLKRPSDPDRVKAHLDSLLPAEDPITQERRDKLADAMRAGAKVAKDTVRAYINGSGFTDLMDLTNTADASRFRKAERWIAVMNHPTDKPIDPCLSKALDDEPRFTLLARDRSAPCTVLEWCVRRTDLLCEKVSARAHNIVTPVNMHLFFEGMSDDEKEERDLIENAMSIARRMELWRKDEVAFADSNGVPPRWKRQPEARRNPGKSPLLGAPYSGTGEAPADVYAAVAASLGKGVETVEQAVAANIMPEISDAKQDVLDTLIAAKKPDNFQHESPIRAFTDFQTSGNVAIGKGFRPALRHLAPYLDAMERKEGWSFVQVILPTSDASDPTILFHKTATEEDLVAIGETVIEQHVRNRRVGDAVNPVHYDGRACADIGERLSANGYQILKYVWRLGKKDDPCIEMGKGLWYAESEKALLVKIGSVRPNVWGLVNPEEWFEQRIEDQPQFTQDIARRLWAGYGMQNLNAIIEAMTEHRFHLDCGRGLAL